MALIIRSVKTCALGPPSPLSLSVPAEAGRLLWTASGKSLHCFPVGVNKSYVIATGDFSLFIHASNLLPSLPTPLPYMLTVEFFFKSLKKKLAVMFIV